MNVWVGNIMTCDEEGQEWTSYLALDNDCN